MGVTQKIVPHLWFDKHAKEAAQFYVDVFGNNSKVHSVTTLHDTPSGDVDTVSFEILGYKFMAISAGPLFKFNPSISFMVNFDPSQDPDARKRIDEIWEKLSKEGKALMPLDKYPFSERYGWIVDKYGMSWQLMYTNPEGEKRPLIIPALLFVTDTCDKAEEATDFYISVFKNSKRGALTRYPAGAPARNASSIADAGGEPNKEGSVSFTDFTLEGQWFAAMDGSSDMHKFAFNEAVSLMVYCEDQKEIDYYWEKLSAVPESEQCGWCKDKFGLSWQIIPKKLGELLSGPDREKSHKVANAMLKMKKIVVADLEKAYA